MNSEMELRDINEENLLSIIGLKVSEDQMDQVASNSTSIAQGNYRKSAWFKGIFHDGKPVHIITYWWIVQNFEKWCMMPRGN